MEVISTNQENTESVGGGEVNTDMDDVSLADTNNDDELLTWSKWRYIRV